MSQNHDSRSNILPHHGITPQIGESVFLAPGSFVIGDVQIGKHSSVWFQSVIRGDVNFIRIGERTNIQDLSMIHVSYKKAPTLIGNDVTIGHKVMLHACTLEDRILVGMGAIIMDNCHIESDVLIAAGSLLTEGTRVPSGSLVMGSPAKVKRALTPEEIKFVENSARHYQKLSESYLGGPWPVDTGFR